MNAQLLTQRQLNHKKEFKKFVDRDIIPYSAFHDQEERLHPKVIESLKKSMYLGSMIPKEYGGLGLDWITIGILNEEIGRGCSSVRSLLTVHGMVSLAIVKWGSEQQKKSLLPKLATGEILGAFALTEPEVGSDASSIETSAVSKGDSFIINGQKKWTTMAEIADIFLVFAKYNGEPAAFLVEGHSKGFYRSPMRGLMGVKASMIAEIQMDNCCIPQDNLVGTIGTGLSHVALHCLDYGRYTVAWGCVGLAQACLEESVRYSRKRTQFGRPIIENQLIKQMISHMVVNTKAGRQLCYKAGYLKDMADPDSIMETWAAKYFVATMVNKMASDAVQIHGANGISKDFPVERYLRDAKINEIIEGSTQIHEIFIANNTF